MTPPLHFLGVGADVEPSWVSGWRVLQLCCGDSSVLPSGGPLVLCLGAPDRQINALGSLVVPVGVVEHGQDIETQQHGGTLHESI